MENVPRSWRERIRGHVGTIVPHLRDSLFPISLPGQPWHVDLEDSHHGKVRLQGVLHAHGGSDAIIVIVHGMGGSYDKNYVLRSASWALERGFDVLRLGLRGAGEDGQDIYHAGLVDDLDAALASPALEGYRYLHVLGFSLGGHMALCYGLSPAPRVRSIAAYHAPLDLAATSHFIDMPSQFVYRHYLLRGLKAGAQAVLKSGRHLPTTCALREIRSVRQWDEHVVAPRFGFSSREEYYRQVSVGGKLADLAVPTRLVHSSDDPMVSYPLVEPHIGVGELVIARRGQGGHVEVRDEDEEVEAVFDFFRDSQKDEG